MKREKIEESNKSDKIREKSESKSNSKQFQSRTGGNDWGRGSVYYLDRHSVDCGPGKVLQGFHLYRPAWNSIAYEFACKSHPAVLSNTYNDQTRWNDTDNNERTSTNYLDRHDVRCRGGYALQQFKLIRNGRNIAYQFRCVQINAQGCNSGQTAQSWGNRSRNFENIFLDRQRVYVGENRALTQFKLNSSYRNGGVFYTYGFSSCQLANSVQPPPNRFLPGPSRSSNIVEIVHKPSGLCLDATGNRIQDGTGVILYTCHGGSNQKWHKNITGNKLEFAVKGPGTSKVIDVTGGSNHNGAKIIIWQAHGGDNQKWYWNPSNGTLKSAKSGKCLDVPGNRPANLVQVQQYDCNGTTAQVWELRSTGGNAPPRPTPGQAPRPAPRPIPRPAPKPTPGDNGVNTNNTPSGKRIKGDGDFLERNVGSKKL